MEATTGPLLKWPGAKWIRAEWIISHFPPHFTYVEPYFGSGAVFFTKEPSRHEVIGDIDKDVVRLFRTVREQGDDLAYALEYTPWSRSEYTLILRIC